MLLLIYENGTAVTYNGDLTNDHLCELQVGTLDVFDLSTPVTRLTQDLEWEEIYET